jgi:hypothetical protein
MPEAASRFMAFDLPYFVHPEVDVRRSEAVIRFGHFGVARNHEKNFGLFARLAEEVQRQLDRPLVEFLAVGFAEPSASRMTSPGTSVMGLSQTPLSSEEYARRAQSITYAVGLADPSHYRLVGSTSFLDALCYLKPGIYLRNPYIEHYFDRLGDIGYLCNSFDQVRDVVFSILREFPEDRYRQQSANILRGRRIFEPEAVAPRLRAIVTERQTGQGRPQRDGTWRSR